jgi:GAF domain-containing protein
MKGRKMSQSEDCELIKDEISHYRLVAALAAQERDCSPQTGAAVLPSRRYGGVELARIAQVMQVPVVVATFRDERGMKIFATFGLNLAANWAQFADKCERLCSEGAVVIPNIATHKAFEDVGRPAQLEDVRFFVGIPLRDETGRNVGSLAVMNSQAAVASKGIAISQLSALGKALMVGERQSPIARHKVAA